MNKYKKLKEKKYKIKDNISGYDKSFILKTYRLPNGIIENFFVDVGKDSVQIFALTNNKEVIIVKQFRPGNEEFALELPGGGMENGEDPKKAAERELVEETSFGGTMHYLYSTEYSPYSTGKRHCFLAWDCKKNQKNLDLDDNEFLKIKFLPLQEFLDLSSNGKVRGFDVVYPAAKFIKKVYGTNILENM